MGRRATPHPVRRRDAGQTRDAILRAARRHFTDYGYERAGVRRIAAEAGVTAALINRYFGSKEGLFEEVLSGAFRIAGALPGARRDFGAALTRYIAEHEKAPPQDGFEPLLLMLRSISSPGALALLRERLDRRALGPMAKWLGGRDAGVRAGLVLSTLMGVAILRKVMHSQAFPRGEEARLFARLGPWLQTAVDQG